MSIRLTRLAGWCGILAPLVALSTTFAAIAMSPGFSWQDNGLSALGVGSHPTLFNAGLFCGGVLYAVFAVGLLRWQRPRSQLASIAGGMLVVGASGLALVGVFPDNTGRIHDLVSATYFLATVLAYVLWGTAWLRSGEKVTGILSVAAGVATLLALILAPHRRLAIAVPSILAATIMNSWIFALAVKMLVEPKSPPSPS